MNGSSFLIENNPEGNSVVVTGPWSDAAAQVLASGEADGLILNYARGFSERNIDLLDPQWPLRRLSVIDRSLVDLAPISRLVGLEELSVQAAPNAELDLSTLPSLRSVNGEWSLIGRTLSSVGELVSVVTWMFSDIDMRAFRNQWALRALTVKDAPHLEALDGIDQLPTLGLLELVEAPQLHDISAVSGLSATLKHLKFEKCGRLGTIDDIESLVGLKFLGMSESGDIASLSPVRSLSELETFYAWGSTRIVDADLSPLEQLPRLKEVRMRNRRGYKPQVTELAASVR